MGKYVTQDLRTASLASGYGSVAAFGALADQVDETRLRQLYQRGLALLSPAALLVGILAVDAVTSRGFHSIVWVVLVPGLAAVLCGMRATAAYGVLTVLVYSGVDASHPDPHMEGLSGLILVAVGGLCALVACAGRLRAQRRVRHIREVAETTRRTVLRPLPSRWAGLEQAAAYTTADVAARVGGDFYDIQPSAHGTRLVLGDVQGKGLNAVACASALIGSFREAAAHEVDLVDVAVRMDQRLQRHQGHMQALGSEEPERFATAVLVNFPEGDPTGPRDTHVEIVNCGHLTPLAVGQHGVRTLPGVTTLPLGLFGLTGDVPDVATVPLAAGETLLLVSDGVTEARDGNGDFYPLRDDLNTALRVDPDLAEPRRLVRHVRAAAARHSVAGLTDDTTVLAVRQEHSAPGATESGAESRTLTAAAEVTGAVPAEGGLTSGALR
ncbi:PP2C family protein-serine/threonine phosphatase [Streptomyces sp. B-S-A8]|uniref:PP2C family protein-serine/threonine phosphatase n=1 Tax=Streptomyces solicavernae TaxID=3043614 RepID=A0ABT6RTR8_9ACTN|nr:PP2C family protein-serine/threonine phosphatase [Streptomyces sp. B-S-A8]MDI3387829.1 PP2C family protein-serine/threonine phosphatase [Streptomyces sp. B-S-A8]